jgi:murein DD-endopeptidase MepM/ murein hydrolase activator NlpD
MSRKLFTILILPHAQSKLRKLHLSKGFVLATACVVILVALIGFFSPHLAFKAISQSRAIDKLEAENQALVAEKKQFEESLDALNAQLDGFEERTGRLAEELGIKDDMPVLRPAAGGGRSLGSAPLGIQEILDEEMEILGRRSQEMARSMNLLDDTWNERLRVLAATPSIMPTRGFFSHGYGWRKDPISGKREFHHGVDIAANRGTPIRATADGVVSRATRYLGYGKMVQISHGYGMATRYGHMNEILVTAGQKVRKGQIIGRVGSTGRSTGPHLHYEVFKAGRRVDPRKYLGDKSF